jgi:5-methylcytosine-specific restriction endonuclease McrA
MKASPKSTQAELEYAARYRKTEAYREILRRNRILLAGDLRLTPQQWENIQKAQKGKCHYCKKKRKLTIDHVIPLCKGGQHVKENVVGACFQCNTKKGRKIVTLF